MRSSRIQAVDHLLVEAPPGIEDDLRWFYGEVAQLQESPATLDEGYSISFRSERLALRFRLRENPYIDPIAFRVTIAVPSLWDAAQQLAERAFPVQHLRGFLYTERRLATQDPAGNRVLLKQVWGGGPL